MKYRNDYDLMMEAIRNCETVDDLLNRLNLPKKKDKIKLLGKDYVCHYEEYSDEVILSINEIASDLPRNDSPKIKNNDFGVGVFIVIICIILLLFPISAIFLLGLMGVLNILANKK